jgi:hypothetical protein
MSSKLKFIKKKHLLLTLKSNRFVMRLDNERKKILCMLILVEGMIKSMNSRDASPRPVNVGNPNEFTIIELALELTCSKSKLLINRYRQTILCKDSRIFLAQRTGLVSKGEILMKV